MGNEHQGDIEYTNKVIQNGYEFFQSLAHQLAGYLTKQEFEEYRLSAEYGHTSAKMFIENVTKKGTMFNATEYGPKKCIGVILYDLESNQMILRKTNVDRTIHEFHADNNLNLDDCFGVQYDVFKYLRDSDLIHIHTIEKVSGVKMEFCYQISKCKALRNGRFLHFKGHGTQFFIPIADFKRSEGKPYKAPKKPRKNKSYKK